MTSNQHHPRPSRPAARLGLSVASAASPPPPSPAWASVRPTAQADPGDTFVAIGSSQLVTSEDLAAIQVSG